MTFDSKVLEDLSRDELIAKAQQLGAVRPELLTRPELRDEIIRLSELDASERRRVRGWFGVARDLVASVVSQGLHLPDTADIIRGVNVRVPKAGPPVATVTLAEIYAAQGHLTRALALLDEVLMREPDHEAARLARQRYAPVAANTAAETAQDPDEESFESELEPIGPEIPTFPDVASELIAEGLEPEEVTQESQKAPVVDVEAVATGSSGEANEELSSVCLPEPERTVPSGAIPTRPDEGSEGNVGASASYGDDEDLLFLVLGENESHSCLWRLSARTKLRLAEGATDLALAIKLLEVTGSWEGPSSRESLLLVEGSEGCRTIDRAVGELRAVLGLLDAGRFIPLCVAGQFAVGGSVEPVLGWAPAGSESRQLWARRGQLQLVGLMGRLRPQ